MADYATGVTPPTLLANAAPVRPNRTSRSIYRLALLWALLASSCWNASALEQPADDDSATPVAAADSSLPDVPPAPAPQQQQPKSFASSLGTAVKTIGEDELHILKSPFSPGAFKWNALAVGATGILIANDESVVNQVSPSWHTTSINVSNGTLYGLGATAGGIFVTGLITHNDQATETGIRSAEATVDSVILYAALKAILARQRPYTSNEGKFFSGNWTAGSFPSGHATLAWTLASVMAHEYPNWPMRVLMYSAALTVSTTRVTGGVHFPSDVFAGSVIGFGVGTFVSHKDRQKLMVPRSQNRIQRIENAVLAHVAIQ
jgi:membrane-associated phospholipid phosphatase